MTHDTLHPTGDSWALWSKLSPTHFGLPDGFFCFNEKKTLRKQNFEWSQKYFKRVWVCMQTWNLSRTLKEQDFRITLLPKKRINYDKLCFPTKQVKLYFQIINIHTQGYITHNKFIICNASTGLPKINLWATKCVTKRP